MAKAHKEALASLEGLALDPKALKTGEIFPGDVVPVLTAANRFTAMKWGFSVFKGRLTINARTETAAIKPLFQEAYRVRRCLTLASAYFEWRTEGSKKTKYRIAALNQPLYLAGLYREEPLRPLPVMTILTRAAGPKIAALHDRTPLIVPGDQIEVWLSSKEAPVITPLEDLDYEPVF
jgi:putative SOS response-associated peptidase YedK